MSWWGHFRARVTRWLLVVQPPTVYGGNLAFPSPAVIVVTAHREKPSVRQLPSLCCRVVGITAGTRRCTVRHLPALAARVHTVCAPSATPRTRTVPLTIRAPLRKPVLMPATLPASHRVLLCRYQPAVRARVRLLPRRAKTISVSLRWRCRARQVVIERLRCRSVPSSLVWQLPIARYAISSGYLTTEQRRRCREALQRVAKGYTRVQSVYYPVPAHAVARIEIDERLGVLYVHPRRGRSEMSPACLWVVSGVQLADGQPVRAVLRMD